ncbi:MAG: sigma 54-interacting transcriptional regulator [Desulfofustis sp. PB-SRB1]|nr:sigma 54-interacting transcriptional regulator [Desulfofustis sp. PB-SRB1]
MYALNKLDGNFTPREQKIFEIVSGTIAVSIENGLLYDELTNNVRRLKEERRLLLSQVRSKSSFTSIIGSSPPMRQMFDLIEKVIDTSTTILIQGETGTGKELIAKVIHYNGPLKNKPFVAENCGALPETLLESELFGYVRGAFTGAHGTKKGLFEIADGGTIFLDEISEMPPAMQVKLLRVLQEGQFRPLGATRTVDVNVRIIASTNRDLSEEVTLGRFREDLYYRINVLKITPPPLRKRKEDILPLANHFLEKYATKHNRPVPILTPLTLDLLMEFDWPGNIRQLENEMERAVTVAGGSRTLYPDFLSEKLRQTRQGEAERNMPRQSTLKGAVGRLEARMIREALGRHGGNRSRVAKELGISRQGLLNKIAAYGLAAK